MKYEKEAGQRTDAHLTDSSTDRPTNGIRPKNTTASDRKIVQRADSVPCLGKKVFNDAIGPNRKFGPMTQFKQIFSLFYFEFVSTQPHNLL